MMDSKGYKCQSLGQRKEIGGVEYSCQRSEIAARNKSDKK
jgi:hypothetical protein